MDFDGFKSLKFRDEQAESILKGLMQRPRFSIRNRIAIGFLLTFVLTFGTTIGAMVFISSLGQKQRFLENAGNFEFEIQQARRFEKNYFLYNTNLIDAIYHVQNARSLLTFFKDEMSQIFGEDGFDIMSDHLNHYEDTMQKLVALSDRTDSSAVEIRRSLEPELRRASARIVTDALTTIDQERGRVQNLVNSSIIVVVIGLSLVLGLELIMATFIIGHIIRPFKRFEKYFQRIAGGDFSLITPTRRYRDEFSSLAVAINHMLTELKKQQEQIVQSRKMGAIGTLTAGIAHELNNPLNNIGITIEALLDEFTELDDEKKLTMLKDAFDQVGRASVTIRNLLDFTRQKETSFEDLSVNDVINMSLKLVANEIIMNKIRLELDLSDHLPRVKGDWNNLQQVFINMFLNSIQAMPDGGELRIKSYVEDKYVKVDICDSGIGMPPEILEKIFDPFFTTKKMGKGAGLGLSVSYGIIKKHDGLIMVKSEVGKGTTFSIKLPFSDGKFTETSKETNRN